MPNKPISEYSDIELAKIQQQEYEMLIRSQNNLQAISAEIKRREDEEERNKEAGQKVESDNKK